ncbi:MAG: hypothetical protein IPK78_12685, partial [Rhodospirillales bacterium]|nr:hypothetical protein [Rhodospirillales bacterium]
ELRAVISDLEAAVASHLDRTTQEQDRVEALRAEVEALRATQQTVAFRLDAAISRLKAYLGD